MLSLGIYGLLRVSQFPSLMMTTLDTTRDPSINKHDFTSNDYTVGWICALEIELAASQAMLDEVYPDLLQDEKDSNTYTLGRIGQHNVVLACLPSGTTGTDAAATAAKDLLRSFPKIRFGLMVVLEVEHQATPVTIRLKISVLETLSSATRKAAMVGESST